jgi:polygalacturonase
MFSRIISFCLLPFPLVAAISTFNVRDHGAAGDGATSDTKAINAAVEACSKAGGGQVLFPPGRYLSGTVNLRSHVALFLEAGARLVGTTNLEEYQFPQHMPNMPEARWGKWHRALVLGESVEDIKIAGQGTIDGNKVFDPTGEERKRGPHTIVFVNSRRFSIRDVSIVDSANYAVLFQASDDVDIRHVKIVGGWDGVHFRGAPDKWCRNVNIIDCEFYTGDDSIAGRYWDNCVINNCVINSSCNGIRIIGPVTRTVVNNCLFYGPGQQPHRTGGRTNMLSGIILQPGAWDATRGVTDDILFANNTMHNVTSAVTIWQKPGNTMGRVTVNGLHATQVYRAAMSAESWADEPITNVVFRNVSVEYTGGGTAQMATNRVKGPGVDARALPSWGFFARNVENIRFENVRFSLSKDDARPVVNAEHVKEFTADEFHFPRIEGVKKPIVTSDAEVKTVETRWR